MNLKIAHPRGEDFHDRLMWLCYVDNAAAVSHQHITCALSKLRGGYDQRQNWIQELENEKEIGAVKIETAKNLADLYLSAMQ